jgi:hypothetical protein
VELLEQRVLLTDVAFFDLLKGQNFAQSGSGNPVLQSGAPFHLHSSAHSPSGFLSAASIRLPNSTTQNLVSQGSTQFRSIEQSFSTKGALDAAFASGNYSFTFAHPMDLNFSPALDASAGANLPAGSRTFSGQVFSPNLAGNFSENWSPFTPNTLDAVGTITANTMTATLKGHVNTAATGSINATWDGSKYAGTYSFNGQNGSVTIPEGFKATLNLPVDAYPNAPHVTNFAAAQAINPAGAFTFTWDAFVGGTSSDLITLFIFDGTNQVYHTNPVPLPSSDPLLNGTATSFTLPKNTLQANKTYNAQLWFTNYTTIDSASIPGGKGATGYYRVTNFTIKTGAAIDNSPADVAAYYVAKVQDFVQTGAGTPVLDATTPFAFAAFVDERETAGATVNNARISLPTNPVVSSPQILQSDGINEWDFFREFNNKTDLDAAFKPGGYRFSINTVNQGLKTPAVTLPPDAYPVTPHVSNWANAQLIDASSAFTLNWDAFTGGTTEDFIQVSIVDQSGATVFRTPNFWEANPLVGTARSVLIPAGTFIAGESYDAQLLFANASTLDRTTYRNSLGTTAYTKRTAFSLQTIPPEGVLTFRATPFSVNENANPATTTIVVARIGGSAGEVTVNYATSNGSATAGEDYTGVTGTLTFADGESRQTFDIPILDDDLSEGHETVALRLTNPTNGALLGTRPTTTLSILDNELTFGPGNFIDSDGDKYAVALTGPGQARIALDDADGDGKGSISSITLTDTTNLSALSITVTRVTGGDGEVRIGRVAGGTLKSFIASKSDLVGSGLSFSGAIGEIVLDDLLSGADLLVGGTAANSTKVTLGDVAVGSEVRSGATLSTLATQSFRGELIQGPAIGSLSTAAGPLLADLNVTRGIKTLAVKGGPANGDWTALNFGTVSITNGTFTGTLRATGTLAQLASTPAVASLSIVGGNLKGLLSGLAAFGNVSVTKNLAGIGGTVVDSTLSAKSFGTITIATNLVRSRFLAGANLGRDQVIGGIGTTADRFGVGTIGTVTIGGSVVSSILGAGLDPFGEIFHNGNDVVIGSASSSLSSLTITGTASSDSYFRAGSLPASVKIAGATVNPKVDPRFNDFAKGVSAAETDENGSVTLDLLGHSMTFQFVNQTNQQGIPGLLVALATNTGTSGLALLLTIDPTEEYSPELVILHGGLESPDALPMASNEPQDSSAVDVVVELLSELPNTISSLELEDKLPKVPSLGVQLVGALETVGTAVKVLDQLSGGRISRFATQHELPLFTRPEWVNRTDLRNEALQTWQEDINNRVLFLSAGLGLGNAGIAGAAAAGAVVDTGVAIQDLFFIDSNPDRDLLRTEFLGRKLIFTEAEDRPVVTFTPVFDIHEDRPDSIKLFDKLRPNVAFDIPINDGTPFAVPPGQYEMIQERTGRPPVRSSIDLPPDGGNVPLRVPAPHIASLTLEATPRPTGLLDPGSQIRFTVIAKDASNNVIPNDQIDLDCLRPQVFNPVGSTVGTLDSPRFAIDPATGKLTVTLTIGNDLGAMRVSAKSTCDEKIVTSNSILASGLSLAVFNLPIISFDSTALSFVEGSGGGTKKVQIPIRLNKLGSQPVSVSFNTQDRGAASYPPNTASAKSGVDYRSRVSKVDFNGLQAVIEVEVFKDNVVELNKQFVIGLLNPVNARLNIKNTATITIQDDDEAKLFIENDVRKQEGHSGTTDFVFNVKLSNPHSQAVTVDVRTDYSNARPPADYTHKTEKLTFLPGEQSKTFTVKVNGDRDNEADELFFVILSNPTRVTLDEVRKVAIGTILNDDILDPNTALTGTFQGNWTRPIFGFGNEVSQLTWNLTQSGSTVSGTFRKVILSSPIDVDVGQTVTGRLLNGRISGNTLTIETDGGTPFSGTFTRLHIEGFGGSGTRRGPFSLDRM